MAFYPLIPINRIPGLAKIVQVDEILATDFCDRLCSMLSCANHTKLNIVIKLYLLGMPPLISPTLTHNKYNILDRTFNVIVIL